LAEAARQLEKYHPTPADVGDGILFLNLLLQRVPEESWGSVQTSTFAGWEKIRRTPGAQPGIEPIARDLIGRFARWGSREDLERMIRSSNANEYWKREIDLAIGTAARAPAPASGYRGSRLEACVSAALGAGDFERAAVLLANGVWEADATEEGRAPARRLARALELHGKAAAGSPDFPSTVGLWAEAPEDVEVGRVTLKAGVRIARAGRERKDWSLTLKGIEGTKEIPGAPEYWKGVLQGVADEAGKGVYVEEETLAALAAKLGVEAEFWEEVQARTPGKAYPEAMWRVSCWKRVIRATEDPARREAALRRLLEEHVPYDPRAARRDFEELRPLVGEAGAARALAAVEKGISAKEADLALAERRHQGMKAQLPLRSELEWLKVQLQSERSKEIDPQVVANMKRRIAEIEKALK